MTAAASTRLDAALGWANAGWPVFPLWWPRPDGRCACPKPHCEHSGKHPIGLLVPHGKDQATLDADVIRGWWARFPQANIGGRCDGRAVIDVDPRHGGDDALHQLEAQFGPLPQTAENITGSGGRHIIFSYSGPTLPNKELRPGLDLKAGGGGYIVLPRSLHASGRHYEWEIGHLDTPLAPLPAWVVRLALNGHRPATEAPAQGQPIPEGQRNSTLSSIAGRLRRDGLSANELEAALQVVNRLRCQPPLAEQEVTRIATSVGRYPPGLNLLTSAIKNEAIGGEVKSLEGLTGSELLRLATDPNRPPLQFLPVFGQTGFMVVGISHLIFSPPKAGKTTLLYHLAQEWLGAGYPVAYISEESQRLWEERVKATTCDLSGLFVYFALGTPLKQLVVTIREAPAPVVVLDTMRLLGFEDENNNSQVFATLSLVIQAARVTSKTLVLVHHSRKSGGSDGLGASGGHASVGTVDIVLEVERVPHPRNRRQLHAFGRVLEEATLLYERGEDGILRNLGDPKALELREVKDKLLALLSDEWQSTKDLVDAFGDKAPSRDQVGKALWSLGKDGVVERDPALEESAKGKTVRWRCVHG